jgi:ABC-type glycerol-3-phosphate transport system substrate-binding protein
MGFMMSGPWSLIEAHQRMDGKIDWDISHIPVGPRGQRATRHSFDTWTVWSGSKQKDEAYKFVSYALGMEGLKGFSDRAFPAKISAAQKYFIRPETPQHEEIFVDIMLNYTWMQPTYVQWKEVDKIFGDNLTKMYQGKQSPGAAAENMQTEANAVLMELWPQSWRTTYKTTGKLPAEANAAFAADRALRGGY